MQNRKQRCSHDELKGICKYYSNCGCLAPSPVCEQQALKKYKDAAQELADMLKKTDLEKEKENGTFAQWIADFMTLAIDLAAMLGAG